MRVVFVQYPENRLSKAGENLRPAEIEAHRWFTPYREKGRWSEIVAWLGERGLEPILDEDYTYSPTEPHAYWHIELEGDVAFEFKLRWL